MFTTIRHMIHRYTHGSVTWIDVTNPAPNEVHDLIKETGLPIVLATDLTAMTPRTETHVEKKALKITLDFPIVKRTDINHPHEIKFLATKKHLLTIRFEDIEAVDHFAKDFETLTLSKHKKGPQSGGQLMLALLHHLYLALDGKLDYLETKMSDIEEGIFSEREREMVSEISNVSRRLINFRHILGTHESALETLVREIETAFGKGTQGKAAEIVSQYVHLKRRVASLTVTTDDLRETNNSLLTTKQNETMKIFTILAFITFPLTLFTSLFGMNTIATPIVGQTGDFWIILGTMVVVSISFFAYFRYKKWM